MEHLQLEKVPAAKTGMLIRKPVEEVFEAFVDPDQITKFWFTDSTGRLEEGKQVEWTWGMYNVSSKVDVLTVEPNRRIVIEWPTHQRRTTVEWVFTPLENGTFVSIVNSGFTGTGDEVVEQALGSTQGFSLVLAGAKAFLEHGIELNLVLDRFPKGLREG